MHHMKPNAQLDELLSSPRYSQLVNEAVTRSLQDDTSAGGGGGGASDATGRKQGPRPAPPPPGKPLAFARPPNTNPPSAAPISGGTVRGFQAYRAERDPVRSNTKGDESSAHAPFAGLEANPTSVLRECIKCFLANPDTYGHNIRKHLEDELSFIVKMWAHETSTATSMTQRYLDAKNAGLSFLPPINRGLAGGMSDAVDGERTFVENNVFDVDKRARATHITTHHAHYTMSLASTASSALTVVPPSPSDVSTVHAATPGGSGAAVVVKSAVSETFALRGFIAALETKLKQSHITTESFRTELMILEEQLRTEKLEEKRTAIEMEQGQHALMMVRDQLGQAIIALDGANMSRKDMVAEHRREEKNIRSKVEELQEELRYVYKELRLTKSNFKNTTAEVTSLSDGYRSTQCEVEALNDKLKAIVSELQKRNRIIDRQHRLLEQRHAEILVMSKCVGDVRNFAGDRGFAVVMVQEHPAWKLFLAYRLHRRDYHFYGSTGLHSLYGPISAASGASASAVAQQAAPPPVEQVAPTPFTHRRSATSPLNVFTPAFFTTSSDGGYCGMASFTRNLWIEVANLYVALQEQEKKLFPPLEEPHATATATPAAPPLKLHATAIDEPESGLPFTPRVMDLPFATDVFASGMTPGLSPPASRRSSLALSASSFPILAAGKKMSPGPGLEESPRQSDGISPAHVPVGSAVVQKPAPCLGIDTFNPFVLRYSGQASVLTGSVIHEANRHLHVFSVASLLAASPASASNGGGGAGAKDKKKKAAPLPNAPLSSYPNTVFLSRAAARAIIYSFWRQRYAAYLLLLEKREVQVPGLCRPAHRSYADDDTPTPAEFTTALYYFLERAWGRGYSIASTVRPGTPVPQSNFDNSRKSGSYDNASPTKSTGSPKLGKLSPLWPAPSTLPEQALQPATFEDNGGSSHHAGGAEFLPMLSPDAALVLHSLMVLAAEYKEVDADFRLFYLVAFQLIPETYAINFLALTSKLVAEADQAMLAACELEKLLHSSDTKYGREGSSLKTAKPFPVESTAVQIPKCVVRKDSGSVMEEEDGLLELHSRQGSVDDAVVAGALRSAGQHAAAAVAARTPTDNPLGMSAPGAGTALGLGSEDGYDSGAENCFAPALGPAQEKKAGFRSFMSSQLTIAASKRFRTHRASEFVMNKERLHVLARCQSRLFRNSGSTKIPVHTFLEIVERAGFSILEVSLPLKYVKPELDQNASLSHYDSSAFMGPDLSATEFKLSSFCDLPPVEGAGIPAKKAPVDPLAVHTTVGLAALDSQRIAFALGMDQPGNVVDVHELFRCDEHGRPTNFYDELLTLYLNAIERTQKEWVDEVLLPSCRCSSLTTAAARESGCRGLVSAQLLTKNIDRFLKRKLEKAKGKGCNVPFDASSTAIFSGAKLLSAAFIARCEDNDGPLRTLTGDAIPRPYGMFAVDYPVVMSKFNEFIADPDRMAASPASTKKKGVLRNAKQSGSGGSPNAGGGAAGSDGVDATTSLLTAALVSRQTIFLIPSFSPVAVTKVEVDSVNAALPPGERMTPATTIIGPRIVPPTLLTKFELDMTTEFEQSEQRMKAQTCLKNPLHRYLMFQDEEDRARSKKTGGRLIGSVRDGSGVYRAPDSSSTPSTLLGDMTFSGQGIAPRDDGEDSELSTWTLRAYYERCALPLEMALKSLGNRRQQLRIPPKCMPHVSHRVDGYCYCRDTVGLGVSPEE